MPISIVDTLTRTIESIRHNALFFAGLIVLFLLGHMALIGILKLFNGPSFWLALVYHLLHVALYVKLAVTIHRSILLNEAGLWSRVFRWKQSETEFYVLSLAFWLFSMVATFIVGFVLFLFLDDLGLDGKNKLDRVLIESVFVVIFGTILARICLLFPTLAVDENISLEQSIELTRHNHLKVLALIVFMPLILVLMSSVIPDELETLTEFIWAPLIGVALIIDVIILSHIYQALTTHRNGDFDLNHNSTSHSPVLQESDK